MTPQPYVEDDEDLIDITTLAATDLADHCIMLWEKIGHERKKVAKRILITEYNTAATYYNNNIQKVMSLWKP